MRRLVTLALLALALAGPARAQAPGGPPGPLEIIRARAAELGVDPATVEKLGAIATAAQPERQRLMAAVQEARTALDALLRAETPDRKAILAQVDRLGAAETAQMRHSLGILLDLRAELTPAQRAAVEGMMAHPPPPGFPPPGPPPGAPPLPGPPPPGMAPMGI